MLNRALLRAPPHEISLPDNERIAFDSRRDQLASTIFWTSLDHAFRLDRLFWESHNERLYKVVLTVHSNTHAPPNGSQIRSQHAQ